MYNQQLENAVRQFQRESHIEETGVMDLATRQLLNELATTSGFAPTTEFDRAENWPPAPPPYTRAEYQLDRTQSEQAMQQPAAMDRAATGSGQAHTLDPPNPAHTTPATGHAPERQKARH